MEQWDTLEHEEGEEGEAPQYGTMGHADMVTDSYDTLGDIAVPVIMASFAFLGVASIYEKIKG